MSDFVRSFPLIDIAIRSGGDGRTVEAYAAVFNHPTDIADADGRYREQIAPVAFNAAIAARSDYPVYFNHALTMYGTPSDVWSAPVGITAELRTDERGLVSVWRADKTDRGDDVLEMIRNGTVRGQSFSGRFSESLPKKPRGGYRPDARSGELPLVTRMNVVLRELGPTPNPAYSTAAIIGVRAGIDLSGLSPEERADLARTLAATPEGQAGEGIPDVGTAAEGQAVEDTSAGIRAGNVNRYLSLRKLAREKGAI